jgi:hypothetical protein
MGFFSLSLSLLYYYYYYLKKEKKKKKMWAPNFRTEIIITGVD